MEMQINNYDCTVIVEPPRRQWRKSWAKKWRVFGIYLYVSNVRMRMRAKRDLLFSGFREDRYIENKLKVYERQQHRCPHCGREFEYAQLENHHILPVNRFPEYQWSIRNMILLCHGCHKEVHMNPYKNIEMMEKKAKELGVNLNERYEYGKDGGLM